MLLTALLAACSAAPRAPETAQPPPRLPTATALDGKPLDEAIATLGLQEAEIGYLLIDADTGAELAARAPDTPVPPASTAKIATAVAALGALGPNYRFQTDLWARGTLTDGVLKGDLILVGNGDPLLSMGDVRALAQQLRDFGVTRVDGRFLYHSQLPTFPVVEAEQPDSAPYNQGIGGLNVAYNRASWGGAPEPQRLTPTEAVELVTLPKRAPPHAIDVPVRDPALLVARMVRKFATTEGTELPEPVLGDVPPGALPLARMLSQPMIEIVRAGMEYSNNMVAEAVGLATAVHLGAAPRTLHESATATGLWLERAVPDLARFAPNLRNHSGLSTESRVTPRQMTQILRYALGVRFDGWRFDTLLAPGGGREGYRGRFRAEETAFLLWGKTGTMKYIKGLCGYLDAGSGRRLIAAIYINDPARRGEYDAAGRPEGGPLANTANAWRDAAETLEEVLIRKWISSY